jgi:hypothetical protein
MLEGAHSIQRQKLLISRDEFQQHDPGDSGCHTEHIHMSPLHHEDDDKIDRLRAQRFQNGLALAGPARCYG